MSALKSDQYEYHNIEVARGDNLSKDYLDLNPLGTVPALLDTSSDTLVIGTSLSVFLNFLVSASQEDDISRLYPESSR